MNIAQDFQENRVPTEDQDEEGKSHEIQENEPGTAPGSDSQFFVTSEASTAQSAPSNMDPERQAEIERLKKEMADAKEEMKEEEEAAEKYRDMQVQMTRSRTIKRMETETFKLEN